MGGMMMMMTDDLGFQEGGKYKIYILIGDRGQRRQSIEYREQRIEDRGQNIEDII